ncbi:hypothetical protein C5B77_22315 [Aeromonas salmonicida]|nr:hypothetical protein C5B77_22315 [Aeromonas salmonicida]
MNNHDTVNYKCWLINYSFIFFSKIPTKIHLLVINTCFLVTLFFLFLFLGFLDFNLIQSFFFLQNPL